MALEACDVHVVLGGREILGDVTETVDRGERVALIGASGAGKTTLLRLLCGLIRPSSGFVRCDGEEPQWPEVKRISVGVNGDSWLWPRVCLVFQDLALFPNLTGTDNILLGIQGEELRFAKEVMLQCFDWLQLGDVVNRRPAMLSQGERQRIAIVRALVRNPDYLLLDEPTAALDPLTRRRLASLLNRIADERKMAVVCATHDWELCRRVSNRVVALKDGRSQSMKTLEGAVEYLAADV